NAPARVVHSWFQAGIARGQWLPVAALLMPHHGPISSEIRRHSALAVVSPGHLGADPGRRRAAKCRKETQLSASGGPKARSSACREARATIRDGGAQSLPPFADPVIAIPMAWAIC